LSDALTDWVKRLGVAAEKVRIDGERSEAARESVGGFLTHRPGTLGVGLLGKDRSFRWLMAMPSIPNCRRRFEDWECRPR